MHYTNLICEGEPLLLAALPSLSTSARSPSPSSPAPPARASTVPLPLPPTWSAPVCPPVVATLARVTLAALLLAVTPSSVLSPGVTAALWPTSPVSTLASAACAPGSTASSKLVDKAIKKALVLGCNAWKMREPGKSWKGVQSLHKLDDQHSDSSACLLQ